METSILERLHRLAQDDLSSSDNSKIGEGEMKWEYMYITHSDYFNAKFPNIKDKVKKNGNLVHISGGIEFFMKYLNEFGAEGWEIINFVITLDERAECRYHRVKEYLLKRKINH